MCYDCTIGLIYIVLIKLECYKLLTYLYPLNAELLWCLGIWGYVLAILILTQMTIASVTIYLHRNQTHRALTLHPIISHVFRFWLWLTTGMVTADWVAIHRKHHATTDI